MSEKLKKLAEIAEREFPDIVEFTEITHKLRIFIVDGSFVDVWLSERLNRYAYHWERRHINGKIFKHDNIPHAKWKYVKTFPKHFHDGNEENVVESNISDKPEKAIREFLTFIRKNLKIVFKSVLSHNQQTHRNPRKTAGG